MTGFRISFYDSDNHSANKINDTPKESLSDTNLNPDEMELLHAVENVDEAVSNTDNRNYDVGLTQAGKGCFDLLDEDLDCLLVSQKTDHHNLDRTSNSNVNMNETGKKLEDSGVTVMNTEMELEKDSVCQEGNDHSGNRLTETETSTKDRTENSTNKDQILMQDAVDWSKGKSERQTDGQTVEPVTLLVPGQVGSNKRPPSPTLDKEMQMLTPPSKKRQSSIQVSVHMTINTDITLSVNFII